MTDSGKCPKTPEIMCATIPTYKTDAYKLQQAGRKTPPCQESRQYCLTLELGAYRPIEWLRLEGISGYHVVQPPLCSA